MYVHKLTHLVQKGGQIYKLVKRYNYYACIKYHVAYNTETIIYVASEYLCIFDLCQSCDEKLSLLYWRAKLISTE